MNENESVSRTFDGWDSRQVEASDVYDIAVNGVKTGDEAKTTDLQAEGGAVVAAKPQDAVPAESGTAFPEEQSGAAAGSSLTASDADVSPRYEPLTTGQTAQVFERYAQDPENEENAMAVNYAFVESLFGQTSPQEVQDFVASGMFGGKKDHAACASYIAKNFGPPIGALQKIRRRERGEMDDSDWQDFLNELVGQKQREGLKKDDAQRIHNVSGDAQTEAAKAYVLSDDRKLRLVTIAKAPLDRRQKQLAMMVLNVSRTDADDFYDQIDALSKRFSDMDVGRMQEAVSLAVALMPQSDRSWIGAVGNSMGVRAEDTFERLRISKRFGEEEKALGYGPSDKVPSRVGPEDLKDVSNEDRMALLLEANRCGAKFDVARGVLSPNEDNGGPRSRRILADVVRDEVARRRIRAEQLRRKALLATLISAKYKDYGTVGNFFVDTGMDLVQGAALVLTAVGTKNPALTGQLAFAMYGPQSAADTATKLIGEGASADDVRSAAVLSAGINAGLETLGTYALGGMVRPLIRATPFAKNMRLFMATTSKEAGLFAPVSLGARAANVALTFARNTGIEFSTEIAQNVATGAVEGAYSPQGTFVEGAQEGWSDSVEQMGTIAAETAILGVLGQGAGRAGQWWHNRRPKGMSQEEWDARMRETYADMVVADTARALDMKADGKLFGQNGNLTFDGTAFVTQVLTAQNSKGETYSAEWSGQKKKDFLKEVLPADSKVRVNKRVFDALDILDRASGASHEKLVRMGLEARERASAISETEIKEMLVGDQENAGKKTEYPAAEKKDEVANPAGDAAVDENDAVEKKDGDETRFSTTEKAVPGMDVPTTGNAATDTATTKTAKTEEVAREDERLNSLSAAKNRFYEKLALSRIKVAKGARIRAEIDYVFDGKKPSEGTELDAEVVKALEDVKARACNGYELAMFLDAYYTAADKRLAKPTSAADRVNKIRYFGLTRTGVTAMSNWSHYLRDRWIAAEAEGSKLKDFTESELKALKDMLQHRLPGADITISDEPPAWADARVKTLIRNGVVNGVFSKNGIWLSSKATLRTAMHEVLWHATFAHVRAAAEKGDTRAQVMIERMRAYARSVPEAIRQKIYGEMASGGQAFDPDLVLDEVGARLFEREFGDDFADAARLFGSWRASLRNMLARARRYFGAGKDEIADDPRRAVARIMQDLREGKPVVGSVNPTVIRFSIGQRRKDLMRQRLHKKLATASDEQVNNLVTEIERLGEQSKKGGDARVEDAALFWIMKGSVLLPEDNHKILQALDYAKRIKGMDYRNYDSPQELINVCLPKTKEGRMLNPDNFPKTLTNKKVLPYGITVYDVADTEDGQRDMRKIMTSHLGPKSSPWCLLQGDENGELAEGASDYWKMYSAVPKRVAFHNGKLAAFCASVAKNMNEWWDLHDERYEGGIPFFEGADHGRTCIRVVNEKTGEISTDSYFRGGRKNGIFEKWTGDDVLVYRGKYKNYVEVEYDEWLPDGRKSWSLCVLDNGTQVREGRSYVDEFLYKTYTVTVNTRRVVEERWFRRDGTLFKSNETVDGEKRTIRYFYENGALAAEIFLPELSGSTFYKDGTIERRAWVAVLGNEDITTRVECYDKNGTLVYDGYWRSEKDNLVVKAEPTGFFSFDSSFSPQIPEELLDYDTANDTFERTIDFFALNEKFLLDKEDGSAFGLSDGDIQQMLAQDLGEGDVGGNDEALFSIASHGDHYSRPTKHSAVDPLLDMDRIAVTWAASALNHGHWGEGVTPEAQLRMFGPQDRHLIREKAKVIVSVALADKPLTPDEKRNIDVAVKAAKNAYDRLLRNNVAVAVFDEVMNGASTELAARTRPTVDDTIHDVRVADDIQPQVNGIIRRAGIDFSGAVAARSQELASDASRQARREFRDAVDTVARSFANALSLVSMTWEKYLALAKKHHSAAVIARLKDIGELGIFSGNLDDVLAKADSDLDFEARYLAAMSALLDVRSTRIALKALAKVSPEQRLEGLQKQLVEAQIKLNAVARLFNESKGPESSETRIEKVLVSVLVDLVQKVFEKHRFGPVHDNAYEHQNDNFAAMEKWLVESYPDVAKSVLPLFTDVVKRLLIERRAKGNWGLIQTAIEDIDNSLSLHEAFFAAQHAMLLAAGEFSSYYRPFARQRLTSFIATLPSEVDERTDKDAAVYTPKWILLAPIVRQTWEKTHKEDIDTINAEIASLETTLGENGGINDEEINARIQALRLVGGADFFSTERYNYTFQRLRFYRDFSFLQKKSADLERNKFVAEEVRPFLAAVSKNRDQSDPKSTTTHLVERAGDAIAGLFTLRQRMLGMIKHAKGEVYRKAEAFIESWSAMIDKATLRYEQLVEQNRRWWDRALIDIWGSQKNAAQAIARATNTRIPELRKFNHRTDVGEGTLDLTPMQALHIYMSAKQKSFQAALDDPGAFKNRDDAGELIKQREAYVAQLAELEEWLHNYENGVLLKLAEKVHERWAELRPLLNEAYHSVFGFDIYDPYHETDYYPLRFFNAAGNGVQNPSARDILLPISRRFQARTVNVSELDTRVGFLDVVVEQLQADLHTIAFANAHKFSERITKFGEFERVLQGRVSPGARDGFNRHLGDIFALPAQWEKETPSTKIFSDAAKISAVAALAGNPFVVLRQALSGGAFLNYMTTKDFMNAVTLPLNFQRFVSLFKRVCSDARVQARYTTSLNFVQAAILRGEGNWSRIRRNLTNLVMAGVAIGDAIPVAIIGTGIYEQAYKRWIRRGADDATAHDRAIGEMMSLVERTQQTRRMNNKNELARSNNAFVRGVAQFKTAQDQFLANEIRAVSDFFADPRDKSKTAKAVRSVVTHHVLIAGFSDFVVQLVYMLLDDDREFNTDEFLFAVMLGGLYGTTVAALCGTVSSIGRKSPYGHATVLDSVPGIAVTTQVIRQAIRAGNITAEELRTKSRRKASSDVDKNSPIADKYKEWTDVDTEKLFWEWARVSGAGRAAYRVVGPKSRLRALLHDEEDGKDEND